MSAPPQLSQIAICTADAPLSARVLSEGLGFADAGVRFLWGSRLAQIQGLPVEDARCTLAWFVGRQEFVQIELWQHTHPAQALRPDRQTNDLGWTRFGVAVPDFDASLERLSALGVQPIAPPRTAAGLRRVAVEEPGSRVVIELFDDGPALPGGVRQRFHGLEPAVLYAAISVSDLTEAKRFFFSGLELAEVDAATLHADSDEELWGLVGARAERAVGQAGDAYLEIVRYHDPPGRAPDPTCLLSDQGFLNVAFGYRDEAPAVQTLERLVASGYVANRPLPERSGATYVQDRLGNTVELLICPRELDDVYGFDPKRPSTPISRARPR